MTPTEIESLTQNLRKKKPQTKPSKTKQKYKTLCLGGIREFYYFIEL